MSDLEDKTEDATQKKLDETRQKGQVAKSQDFSTAILLIGGLLVLYSASGYLFEQSVGLMRGVFLNLMTPIDSVETASYWFQEGLQIMAYLLMPSLGAAFVLALISGILQVGFHITPEALIPKFSQLNIFSPSTYKKLFSKQALMRLLFGVAKLTAIGLGSYWLLGKVMAEIFSLSHANGAEILAFTAHESFYIALIISLFLFALGVADLLYQRHNFNQEQKMSKQEIKDEHKQSEGDQHVRGRMRQLMASFSRSRIKTNVPHADVIIANPTHFAIALKYDQDKMAAPVCLAKGKQNTALMIKKIAQENNIPIMENPPLARALYAVVEMGQFIPPDFYHAVAEVLAYIYKLKHPESAQKTKEK